jgi:hypothetical protein
MSSYLVPSAAARSDGYVTVASGRLAGTAWTLRASESPGTTTGFVQACFSLTTHRAMTVSSKGCGEFSVAPDSPSDTLFGISERDTASCPFGLAYGAVVGSARHVELTLGSGRVVEASAVTPPHGLPAGVRFYTVAIPCTDTLRTAVARSGSGRVVARLAF